MLARYKNGCLQKIKRKDGTERWQFRWNALCPDGVIRERKKTLGLVSDYPQRSRKLQDLLAGLRQNINTDGPTELTVVTLATAVEQPFDILAAAFLPDGLPARVAAVRDRNHDHGRPLDNRPHDVGAWA